MTTIANWSFRWKTPDGACTIFVSDESTPHIQIFIGKAGSTISAWAWALAEMTNFALSSQTLEAVIEKLSDISSDRSVFSNNVHCRSTAEALAFSLIEYKRAKHVRSKLISG